MVLTDFFFFLKWWIAGIFAGLMLSYFVLVYVPVYFIYNKLESKSHQQKTMSTPQFLCYRSEDAALPEDGYQEGVCPLDHKEEELVASGLLQYCHVQEGLSVVSGAYNILILMQQH